MLHCLSAARRNHNTNRLAKPCSRQLGGYHTLSSTMHLQSLLSDSSRLMDQPLPPSAIPVELRLLVFSTLERFSMNLKNPQTIQNINHTYLDILS